jgi:hypothetical protein
MIKEQSGDGQDPQSGQPSPPEEPAGGQPGGFRGVASVETRAPAARAADRFGLYIDHAVLPGDRDALRQRAEVLLAPPDFLTEIERLPPDVTYRDVDEVRAALGNAA